MNATLTDYIACPRTSYPNEDVRFYTLKANSFFAQLAEGSYQDQMPIEFMNARNFYMEAIRCDQAAFIPNANLILLYLHQGFISEATRSLSEALYFAPDSQWLQFVNSCLKYDANSAGVEKFIEKWSDFSEEIMAASAYIASGHRKESDHWMDLVMQKIGKEEHESLWSLKRVVNAGKLSE